MKKRKIWNRCIYCGRFIGLGEFMRGEVETDFTPDTHFTYEKIEHYHKKCKEECGDLVTC